MRLGELQKSLLSDVLTINRQIAPAKCSEAMNEARTMLDRDKPSSSKPQW